MSTLEYILVSQLLSTVFLIVAMAFLSNILISKGKIMWYIAYKRNMKGGWSPSIISGDYLKRNSFKQERQKSHLYEIDEKDHGKTIDELVEIYPPPPSDPED